jgi:uncharacterized protein YaeQ
MALRATVYKAELNIADNDRAYYGSHAVTLARHPSETDERLMVRVLVYALNVRAEDDALAYTRGLSETDEPDLWRQDLTGAIETWIETGLPDERRVLKACGRAAQVLIYAYGRNAGLWWSAAQDKLQRARNLTVYSLPAPATQALAALAQRNMALNINVQDSTAWVSAANGEASIEITPWRP